MKLVKDWKRVLTKALSARLMLIAGLLTMLETVVQAAGPENVPVIKELPNALRALVIGGVIGAAWFFRIVAQKDFEK